MNDLVAKIIAAGEKATENELFDDASVEGGKKVPTFYDSFLQRNETGNLPKKEHPFVLVRLVGAEDTDRESRIFVPIQPGIHTYGNRDSGVADIRRLVGLLLNGFADAEQFFPYSLDRIITFFGDHQTGEHPHPKYYANMELTFSRQPILTNVR